MNGKEQNQTKNKTWIKKYLLPVLLLALMCCALTGEAQAAGKKKTPAKVAKQAKETKEADSGFGISTTTDLTEKGQQAWLELYINEKQVDQIGRAHV